MAVTAKLVKELRDLTAAGMMDCKKALEATDGDIKKAVDWLRENGLAKAAKKEGRIAAEGLGKIAIDGNKAVIIEVNSETDFVAKNEKFLELLDVVANTILASDAKTNPIAGSSTSVAVEGTNAAEQIASLATTLKTVQDNASKYKMVALTPQEIAALSDENVKEAYKVVLLLRKLNGGPQM